MGSRVATKAERQRLRREELRDKFKADEYIRQLDIAAAQYDELLAAMDVAVTRKKRLTKKDVEQLNATNQQIEALKFKMDVLKQKCDLNFRRLKFVVPELRSIEMTDPEGKNPLGSLADALRDAVSGSRD